MLLNPQIRIDWQLWLRYGSFGTPGANRRNTKLWHASGLALALYGGPERSLLFVPEFPNWDL